MWALSTPCPLSGHTSSSQTRSETPGQQSPKSSHHMEQEHEGRYVSSSFFDISKPYLLLISSGHFAHSVPKVTIHSTLPQPSLPPLLSGGVPS